MSYGNSKSDNIKKDFDTISIGLASPEQILERSYGEVLKPETINYRSFKPEMDGLFCEKIFGPVKDWECHCGKYKRIRYKGIICDRCGVEVTQKKVRRERMGHITLSVPVVHIWYFKSLPNKIAYLLGFKSKELEKIIYYEKYVVIQPGEAAEHGIEEKQLLTEEEYYEVLYEIREDNNQLEDENPDKFIAKMGGEAVQDLLKRMNLDQLAKELRFQARTETSQQRKAKALKRLKVVEGFREANRESTNLPEWMVMRVIPVIPPELRPLVPLEGGRFATSDLNDLYRRVIIRNNRLKRLIDIKAPEVILRNEKRMLQEAVDSLFDNSRKSNAVRGDSNRALKSLSDMLKGKQGRFRQNLLGKRVDYSGRSVIVSGPELDLHQCGLPKEMAVELYKPFIVRKLIDRGIVKTVKSAKKVVEKRTDEVWDILEKVIQGHPVLLNRAPTLHRLGIQAFQPVLTESKAIQLHPLVCPAYNADFDGDQMAVHVPLSEEACIESMVLMLSSHNIMSPAHGGPLAVPSQDMVLGVYYLTKARDGAEGEGKRFGQPSEVRQAYDQGVVELHARIELRLESGDWIETTVGRAVFNEIVPDELGYLNDVLDKKSIRRIIGRVFQETDIPTTAEFLDRLKKLGFEESTMGGLTFSLSDIVVPEEKAEMVEEAEEEVEEARQKYEMGFITDNERYNQVIDIWTRVNNNVSDVLFNTLKEHKDGFNHIYMAADSGARGSQEQIRQLGGMRGLMAKPQKSKVGSGGEIIENPILSNFKDGLSVQEYFISTHGARKGLADTALKTADAGYLTRRLVDVAQDVVVKEQDCGTLRGLRISALKENEEIVEPLEDRILGRVSVHDIEDPLTGDLLVRANELIDEGKAEAIAETSIEEVEIRSVLTCEARRGVCALCYGRNLARGRMVQVGEAVGVVAAQSIGEPGTQLTLRTFHTGGTASQISAESTVQTKFGGEIEFEHMRTVTRQDEDGETEVVLGRSGEIRVLDEDGRELISYGVPYGAELLTEEGAEVEEGDVLASWDPYNSVIVTERSGKVGYKDIIEGTTYREETDEQTGHKDKVIIDPRDRSLTPTITIHKDGQSDADDQAELREKEYPMPVNAHIQVDESEEVQSGEILAKIPRQTAQTKDITGGLPRVTELFEARTPSDPSEVSEIDGVVSYGGRKRGSQEVHVESRDGETEKTYLVSLSKHLLVHPGDIVEAGDPLSDGQISPEDILHILGPKKVQEYLLDEIQEVYRLQGVEINDKHFEIIIRQMMKRVEIADPGDTRFLEREVVNRFELDEVNNEIHDRFVVVDTGDSELEVGEIVTRRALREVNSSMKRQDLEEVEVREARPAVAKPILLGITRAALSTESWLSAASFQETTKVLTEASIEGKTDELHGLKENVIAGRLVPAGTGRRRYRDIVVGSTRELSELQAALGGDGSAAGGDGEAETVEPEVETELEAESNGEQEKEEA